MLGRAPDYLQTTHKIHNLNISFSNSVRFRGRAIHFNLAIRASLQGFSLLSLTQLSFIY